tara:strand:- start:184344 stop:184784 length:441 start_codon:yes stop_codon:yes gene_type:complete
LRSLECRTTRNWQEKLPEIPQWLSQANTLGHVIVAPVDFQVFWNGGAAPEDVCVNIDPKFEEIVSSQIGGGTISLRVKQEMLTQCIAGQMFGPPPNYFVDGMSCAFGVFPGEVADDEFTFLVKMTRADQWISVEKDHPLIGFYEIS